MIQFHQTRDARDEAAKATADSSATGDVLLGRKEASPVARGDHDPVEDPDAEDAPDQVVTIDGEPASDWFDRMCDDRGLPFSTALAIARGRNDQGLEELPPFGEEDPAVAQWDDLPRDDDGEPAVDVIHATHQFAHVPSLRTHTNVILDEQPDCRIDLSDQQVRDMVNAYLRAVDAPVTHFEGFVMLARNDDARGDAAAERDALDDALGADADLPTEWYVETDGAHALAPTSRGRYGTRSGGRTRTGTGSGRPKSTMSPPGSTPIKRGTPPGHGSRSSSTTPITRFTRSGRPPTFPRRGRWSGSTRTRVCPCGN
ncbi:hypothetical protein [Halorubrum halophilum]|uniref:hypothetical protein n=1 Tax=Halorubrum halophilum TaxID=413816 RepID=UPI00186B2199|nr:hypothetical protein [Halorubrum halophilum]